MQKTKIKTKISTKTAVLISVAVIGIGGLAYASARTVTPSCVKEGKVIGSTVSTTKCCVGLVSTPVSKSSISVGEIAAVVMVDVCKALPGDLVRNGKVDSADVKQFNKILTSVRAAIKRADMNGDGILDEKDLSIIQTDVNSSAVPNAAPVATPEIQKSIKGSLQRIFQGTVPAGNSGANATKKAQ